MPHPVERSSPLRVMPTAASGRSLERPLNAGSARGQGTAAPRVLHADSLEVSSASLSLSHLVQTWGILSRLFGQQSGPVPGTGLGQDPGGSVGQPPQQGPDWAGIQQAISGARQNLSVMQEKAGVMDTLKSSVLQQAEALVNRVYGLQGDGAALRVVFDDELGNTLAYVGYTYDSKGRAANMELHLNLSEFIPDTGPNGVNDHTIQNDRIIAHELTHAVMGRNVDMRHLPVWFIEGTAEYVAGGAERVSKVLGKTSPQGLMNLLEGSWVSDSAHYAAAYAAVRYLDQAVSKGGGVRAVMAALKEGASLDDAITHASGGAIQGTAGLLDQLVHQGKGAAFLRTLDLSGRDPGSASGAHSGADVVPDSGLRTAQPLKGFRIQWPSVVDGLPNAYPLRIATGTAEGAAAAYRQMMPAPDRGPS